jgi:hypothetical protein
VRVRLHISVQNSSMILTNTYFSTTREGRSEHARLVQNIIQALLNDTSI